MKYSLAVGLLVVSGTLWGEQKASAEYRVGFQPGFELSCEGANNSFFYNLLPLLKTLETDGINLAPDEHANHTPQPAAYAARPSYPYIPYPAAAPMAPAYSQTPAPRTPMPVFQAGYTLYAPIMPGPYPYYPTYYPNYYYYYSAGH